MAVVDEVRAMFAGQHFGAACADTDIRRAETALGETLPPVLRELYLAFDGFLGSTDAAFFWPLFGREGLVAMNQFYRGGDLFPHNLVSQCLFFGDNGCGPLWGFHRGRPGKVVQWDAAWGEDFEVVGDGPLEVWRTEKATYDSLSEDA